MKRLLLAAIDIYRRWLSPYKGFSCAWRVYRGGDSCSTYGRKVIARFGSRRGIGLLRRRLDACGHQYEFHSARLDRQGGSIHPGCDIGDACDAAQCACDVGDCSKKRVRSCWRAARQQRDD